MSSMSSVSARNSFELGTTSDLARRTRAAANKGFVGESSFAFMCPDPTPVRTAVGSLGGGPFTPNNRQGDLGAQVSVASDQFDVSDKMYQTKSSPAGAGTGNGISMGATNPFSDKTLVGKTGKGSRVEVTPSADGNSVSVRIRTTDGGEYSFDLSENAKINELENGSLLVTLLDSNHRYLIHPDGSLEETMQSADNSGDDIYININGEMVDSGKGNDLVFNFASKATILTGAGNDMVLLGGDLMDLFVDTGDGDDTVIGGSISNSIINTGNGDDTVIFENVGKDCTIDLGTGNNTADIKNFGGTLKAGHGNNTFDIGQALEDAVLMAGTGKNTYLGAGGMYLGRGKQ